MVVFVWHLVADVQYERAEKVVGCSGGNGGSVMRQQWVGGVLREKVKGGGMSFLGEHSPQEREVPSLGGLRGYSVIFFGGAGVVGVCVSVYGCRTVTCVAFDGSRSG